MFPVGFRVDFEGHEIIDYPAELDLGSYGIEIVESGVRNLVRVLWSRLHYKTVCACAGHEDNLPFPWMVVLINAAPELEKLARAIARFNTSLGNNSHPPRVDQTWVLLPLVNANSGFAIYIQPADINNTCSTARISELRKSADALAEFLETKCADIFE